MYTTETKIGIIGSGIVGRVLASAFLKESNPVLLGTRDTSKAEVTTWLKENASGRTGSFSEAASFADIIVLAVAGEVASDALQLADPDNLTNKIIIDATNPISHAAGPTNGVLSFFTDLNQSLMEKLQMQFPAAHFVKAFSCVGNNFMYKPSFKEGKPSMFICGNNEAAKASVHTILTNFGWLTEDMGKAEAARAIEPLCMLWCIPGFLNNQWNHAFKLLRV